MGYEGDFDKWADAGFPGYSGTTEAARAEALASSFVQKARIFHSLILKDVHNAHSVLDVEKLDAFQSQFDDLLQDLVSDCKGMIGDAATELAPDCEPSLPATPDFAGLTVEARLTDTGKARSCPEQLSHDEKIKQAALTAGISGEGVL